MGGAHLVPSVLQTQAQIYAQAFNESMFERGVTPDESSRGVDVKDLSEDMQVLRERLINDYTNGEDGDQWDRQRAEKFADSQIQTIARTSMAGDQYAPTHLSQIVNHNMLTGRVDRTQPEPSSPKPIIDTVTTTQPLPENTPNNFKH